MRNAIWSSILTAVLVVGAVSAMAGPPLNGTYKSTDGDFDEGRESSSWAAGGGGFLGIGNVLHAEAWDGVALGGDWKIVCPRVASVVLLVDMVFAGTGSRIYQIDYTGGYVELGGAGPWGNGDPSYTGVIDTYTEIRTVLYSGGAQVGSTSDHAVGATLQGYSQSCVSWAIGNGVWLGAAPAAGYPSLLDTNCDPTATTGHYGDIRDLTLSITACSVGVEEATWGSVKALYRE